MTRHTPDALALSIWWHAYVWMRQHDLSEHSRTSNLLQKKNVDVRKRIADEMREFAGVLDGTHRHHDDDLRADLILEGSQVLYWLAVQCVGRDLTFDDIDVQGAFDRLPSNDGLADAIVFLTGVADEWLAGDGLTLLRRNAIDTVDAVVTGFHQMGFSPYAAIAHDLAELRSRPYLADYFAIVDGGNVE